MRDAISVPRVRSNERVSDGRTHPQPRQKGSLHSELRNRQQPSLGRSTRRDRDRRVAGQMSTELAKEYAFTYAGGSERASRPALRIADEPKSPFAVARSASWLRVVGHDDFVHRFDVFAVTHKGFLGGGRW